MRLAFAACAVLALSACAHLPVGTDSLSYEARRSRLEAVRTWEMRGRLAVDTGERGFQGSFVWRQSANGLDLTVRGPLGQGILNVTGSPDSLTVTARGETRMLGDPERDLSALLGWWLPVGSLHAWLLGLPDRDFRAVTVEGIEGTMASIDQRLWHLTYPTYQLAPLDGTPSGVLLPRRIDMGYAELALRLTVDSWRPQAPDVP
jgi:outer membrane lipoprotein LolB